MSDVCDTYVHLDEAQECWLCKGTGKGYDENGRCMTCHGDRVTWPGQAICLRDPGHDGPHLSYVAVPCPSCWAVEIHADWCPDMELTTSDGIDIAFDDDGTYWVTLRAEAQVSTARDGDGFGSTHAGGGDA